MLQSHYLSSSPASRELLAEIQCHINFFTGCSGGGASWLRPPCLILRRATTGTAVTLFSMAGREASSARAPDPAMRGPVVLGSTDGWLVSALPRRGKYAAML